MKIWRQVVAGPPWFEMPHHFTDVPGEHKGQTENGSRLVALSVSPSYVLLLTYKNSEHAQVRHEKRLRPDSRAMLDRKEAIWERRIEPDVSCVRGSIHTENTAMQDVMYMIHASFFS